MRHLLRTAAVLVLWAPAGLGLTPPAGSLSPAGALAGRVTA